MWCKSAPHDIFRAMKTWCHLSPMIQTKTCPPNSSAPNKETYAHLLQQDRSSPWLTSHVGSAVKDFEALKWSPEGLLTSLFPLLVPHCVKSTFIMNEQLFSGLTRLSNRLFKSVIIIYLQ